MSVWTKPKMPDDAVRICEYVYTDEAGEPVYKKVRWEWPQLGTRPRGKTFKLHAFLGWSGNREKPRWDLTLAKDARRVPYHLPALRAAIAAKVDCIWLVDGEKDVETLEAAGQVATTAPLGTMGYWLGEHVAYFYGATRVKIIADKDTDGEGLRDAWKVAKSLRLIGVRFDVVQVPVGKDITDFAQAGAA